MADRCILCQQPVRAKQQRIQCDGCFKWNHRTCNTGISQQEYRAAVHAGADIVWFCTSCRPGCPVAESSRTSMAESSTDILESEEFNPSLSDSFDQSTIYGPLELAGDFVEDSISDPRIQHQTAEDGPCKLTYELVESGTKRGKSKLADSEGYTYNVQIRRPNCTYWQCTVRPKGNQCKAIVIQRGDGFQQGKQEHNHPNSSCVTVLI